MGGESGQPYIYEPANHRAAYPYSDFNPRAATQAARQSFQDACEPKPKRVGPLINFNQHPDSYMIVAGQNVNYKPMSPNTKRNVAAIRWVQFSLRIVEELGAVGILVAVICLKGMETSASWIMRIAPAWDACITLYAIYHLVRNAKARPPMSSASYHMFALFMDTGLLPFYVFISIFSNDNYEMAPGTSGRWTSFFTETGATTSLLFATFIGAAVMTGFHVVSGCLDIWLIVLFRKIANLPPDMNPLEDNLTSRKASKHKHKNSELTLAGSIGEKKPGYLSGSTLSVDHESRLSTANKEGTDARRVPFQHSRMGSDVNFSPHNPETARLSRQQFEDDHLYSQPSSARNSRNELYGHSRGNSASPSQYGSKAEINDIPHTLGPTADQPLSARPFSQPMLGSGAGTLPVPVRFSSPALPNAAQPLAVVKSQQRQGLLNDNWYAIDDNVAEVVNPSRPRTLAMDHADLPETPVSPIQVERHDSFDPQPLKMNPPTPPTIYAAFDEQDRGSKRSALSERRDHGNGELQRGATVTSNATDSSSVYSESAPSLVSSKSYHNSAPKSKYYGDLSAATRGIRGNFASSETLKSNATISAAAMDATGMSALGGYGYAPEPPQRRQQQRSPQKDRGGRVISRSGAELANLQATYQHESGFGIRDRREVSGKVAEEGRGGRWMENRY